MGMDLKLRYVKRSPLPYSQHEILVLQQWNGKKWVDVPIETEGNPANNRDWLNKARVKYYG